MMWTTANTAGVLPTAATLFLLVPFLPHHCTMAVPAPQPSADGATEETYYYNDNDKAKLTHVGHIIDALESLGVLVPPQQTCYKVEKITKMPVTKDAHSWKISIFLYMVNAGSGKPLGGASINGEVTGTLNPSRHDDAVAAESERKMEVTVPQNSCFTNTNTSKNSTEDSNVPLNRSRKNYADSEEADSRGTWVDGYTDVHFSKTQIMVIVTCSTVIGAFFITAFFLRLRNYLKRVHREESPSRARSMAMFGGSSYYSDSVIVKA